MPTTRCRRRLPALATTSGARILAESAARLLSTDASGNLEVMCTVAGSVA